jgi:hypothetical protein
MVHCVEYCNGSVKALVAAALVALLMRGQDLVLQYTSGLLSKI